MSQRLVAVPLLLAFVALPVAVWPQTYTAVTYQYAPLAYPGAAVTVANGVNNGNVVVGSYFDQTFSVHGFTYHDGKYTRVDFPGSTETEILGINDEGDTVGVYQVAGPLNFHGFVLHKGHFTTIDDPQAQFGTTAAGINNSGTVIGTFDDSQGFILRDGVFTTFNAPQQPGDTPQTQLNGINNLGWIAGQVVSAGSWRGFWLKGDDLDFLEPSNSPDNQVTGINGHGDIVGCHDAAAGFVAFAVEQSETNERTDKSPFQNKLRSCVSAINYTRVIVGNYSRIPPTAFIAVPAITLSVTGLHEGTTNVDPVHLKAAATGLQPISDIEGWLNFRKLFQIKGGLLDRDISLPQGVNERVVIRARDVTGATAAVVVRVSIN